MGQANLQNAEVALQKLLLVNNQLEPATLDRGNGVTGCIETSGIDIARLSCLRLPGRSARCP